MNKEDLSPFADGDDDGGIYIDDDPCSTCSKDCDGWDAQYCCIRCRWFGQDDCDNCDPMDI